MGVPSEGLWHFSGHIRDTVLIRDTALLGKYPNRLRSLRCEVEFNWQGRGLSCPSGPFLVLVKELGYHQKGYNMTYCIRIIAT